MQGERLLASRINQLVDAVNGRGAVTSDASINISAGPHGVHLSANLPRFDLVEFDEHVQPGNRDKTANIFNRDTTASSSAAEQWHDTGQDLKLAMDPMQSLYLRGERHLTYFHPGAGQRIPIPGTQIHLGKVVQNVPAGLQGTVNIYSGLGGSAADTGLSVQGYDLSGAGVQKGQFAFVFQERAGKQWWILPDRSVRYGKAVANWGNGPPPTVLVNPCDSAGLSVDTSTAFQVSLLRSGSAAAGDPNVVAGQLIAYLQTQDNKFLCVSDYMDDPIGTVKLWASPLGAIRQGWAAMDGTANALASGGSGIDMRNYFPRGATNAAGIGGAGGSASVTPAAHTIDDHPATATSDTPLTTDVPNLTTAGGVAGGFNVPTAAHTHTIPTHHHNTPILAHTGSLTHAAISLLPSYKALLFIERLNNSA